MRIGVIDDYLAENVVSRFERIQRYKVHKGKVKNVIENRMNYGITHGTSCCSILNNYIDHPGKYSLVHIDIMNNNQLDIRNFIAALTFCLNNQVDILCLSIGTTILSNANKIYPVIKRLSEKGVFIIAASSNANLVTYPAAFEEVMGVVALTTDVFAFQTMYHIPENDLGMNLGIVTGRGGSNSFSSPLILAKLLNMMPNKVVNSPREMLYKIINKEIKYTTRKQREAIEQELLPKDNEPVPIVIVEREETRNNDYMEKIMQCLSEVYNYESICVIENGNRNFSFRFIKFNSEIFHKQLKNRFNSDVDILFLSSAVTNSSLKNMNISEDLYVKVSKTKTILSTSKHQIKHYGAAHYKTVCSDIVLLLS